MKNTFTIINEQLLPSDSASILITDLSVQRGYGIFDFFKTVNGVPVFLEDHLDRFYRSAETMHLKIRQTRLQLVGVLHQLMKANNMPDSGIRLTLTGGYSPDGYTIASPNLVITQSPLTINKELNNRGISILTYEHQRQMPHAKTLDYLMAVWLQPYLIERKADDVLYYKDRKITECPRSNIFIITADDEVKTPANNILHGITRKQLLKMTDSFNVTAADILLDDLYNAREVFITSSTKNILPVIRIDDRQVGDGVPGKLTKELMKQLENEVKNSAMTEVSFSSTSQS
jgi:D-alanine transaminase/branched-chain amino acid aminotransferase